MAVTSVRSNAKEEKIERFLKNIITVMLPRS